MKKLRQWRQIKWFRVMCWKILSALIAWAGALLAWLKWEEFIFVVTIGTQVVDRLTKYVNTRLLNDLWVDKE